MVDGLVKPVVKARPQIVLLEDDNGVRRSLQLLLQGRGFDVRAFGSAESLLADPDFAEADCLVVDYRLAASNGIDVLQSLRAGGWTRPAVLITAFGSAELATRAIAAGFSEIFEKPLKDHLLIAALKRLTDCAREGK
jgi:FixJ family two-component response regulator